MKNPLTILCNEDHLLGHNFTVEEDILPDEEGVWKCSPRLAKWLEEHGLRTSWYLNHTLGAAVQNRGTVMHGECTCEEFDRSNGVCVHTGYGE